MTIEGISKEKSITIKTSSYAFINVGTFLSINFKGEPKYFRVNKIDTSKHSSLTIFAEEHWYKNELNDADIRSLLGLEISVIEDKDLIKKLHAEKDICTYLLSCYSKFSPFKV